MRHHSIQAVVYRGMGDQGLRDLILIGPYASADDCDWDLQRLATLPRGVFGVQLKAGHANPAHANIQVAPDRLAQVTTQDQVVHVIYHVAAVQAAQHRR